MGASKPSTVIQESDPASDITCLSSDDDPVEDKKPDSPYADSDVEITGSDHPTSGQEEQEEDSKTLKSSSDEDDFPIFKKNRVLPSRKNQSLISDYVKREPSDEEFKVQFFVFVLT